MFTPNECSMKTSKGSPKPLCKVRFSMALVDDSDNTKNVDPIKQNIIDPNFLNNACFTQKEKNPSSSLVRFNHFGDIPQLPFFKTNSSLSHAGSVNS